MTTPTPEITIPRLEGESNRAYDARVHYVTMGPGRSLDSVSQKLGKSKALMERWSERYGWVDSARRYDDAVNHVAIQSSAAKYRQDLEAHRADAERYGRALSDTAIAMLAELRTAVKAGDMRYTPNHIALISKALATALDLRAHALQLDALLPTLTADRDDG